MELQVVTVDNMPDISFLHDRLINLSSENADILTELVILNNNLLMIGEGIKFLMIVAGGFLLWKVITIIWGLFYGWFFGGI